MSTRSNIIIKKRGTNGTDYYSIYAHHDGYPSGRGCDLQGILNKAVKDNAFITPIVLAEYINKQDDSFELEGNTLHLHGDIEYLYVINLDDCIVSCYHIFTFTDEKSSVENFINGINVGRVVTCKWDDTKHYESVLVYTKSLIDVWYADKNDEYDSIGNDYREDYGVNDNFEDITDETPVSEWNTSDLYQLVLESATQQEILEKMEGYLTDCDFRRILIEIAEDLQ